MSIISQLQSVWNSLDFSYLLGILAAVLPSLLCITVHELCHGLAALALGDDTARRCGRLSLNPLKHLDPMGLLMMICFHVGWAKPVPVNMARFKNPKAGMALTALAGPVSNLLLSMLLLFCFGLLYFPLSAGSVGQYVLEMLTLGAYISVGLAVFNLLPVPPLDGSRLLFACLRDEHYAFVMRYERFFGLAMLLLVFLGILDGPLSAAIGWLYHTFSVFADLGIGLALLFL